MNKLWYLSQINIFEEMSMHDLEKIDEMVMSTVKKGELISKPGKDNQVLFLLKKGKVRLFKISPDGQQFTSGILGDGNIFGEIETFSTGTSDVYIDALEEVTLCALKKDDFKQLILNNPKLALKMIQVLTDRIRESDKFLEQLAVGDLKSRIIYLLVKLAEKFGTVKEKWIVLNIALTHQELANMVGATRESVSVVLSQLSKNEQIKTARKKISINREEFEQYFE